MVFPRILLLLGSYDPETKEILYRARDHVARSVAEDVYAFLLDELEVYRGVGPSGEEVTVIVEKGDEPAAMIVRNTEIVDYMLISPEEARDPERLRVRLEGAGYRLRDRLRVIEKLEAVAKTATAVLLIRHRGETRCGEYIELTFLLDKGVEPDRVYFLWRREVKLSWMLSELVIEYGFRMLNYDTVDELLGLVEEIASRHMR